MTDANTYPEVPEPPYSSFKVPVTRPMLAAPAKWVDKRPDLSRLQGEYLISPKIDGIRCLIQPGKGPVSRKLLDIPNMHVRNSLWQNRNSLVRLMGSADGDYFEGLDGELVVPLWVAEKMGATLFNATQSVVMSQSHQYEKEVIYKVFDDFSAPHRAFCVRQERAKRRVAEARLTAKSHGSHSGVELQPIEQIRVTLPEDLAWVLNYLNHYVAEGYEGIVLRKSLAPYKYGRSTIIQGGMVKIKPDFEDAEGVILDFEELMRNENEAALDDLGYTKRSTAKGGKVAADTLGALIVDTEWGVLSVGSGFSATLRQEIWENKEAWKGQVITFKYQETPHAQHPRFPIYKGVRHD